MKYLNAKFIGILIATIWYFQFHLFSWLSQNARNICEECGRYITRRWHEKNAFRRPKISSNHRHLKILGMIQRTMDANPNLVHKCASRTCQNNTGNWHTNYPNRCWNDELLRPISATLMIQPKEGEENKNGNNNKNYRDAHYNSSITKWRTRQYRQKITTFFTVYVNFMKNLSLFGKNDEQIWYILNTKGATFMHTVRNTLDATYAPTLNPIIFLKSFYVIHTFLKRTNPPGSQSRLPLIHFQIRFSHMFGLNYP